MNESREAARDRGAIGEADDVLVARARQGDAAALDALVSRHLSAVFQVARRITLDPEAAEDAAQEAWILALRGLSGFRGDASFRTWLLRIAANAAKSALRRSGRRRERGLDPAESLPDGAADPATTAVMAAEVRRATVALDALPEKQRLAVSLRIYQGLTHREIGAVLGCSEVAARVNYHHGMRRLRELLQ